MQIVLCGLSQDVEAAMRRTLGDAPHSIASAPDSTAGKALRSVADSLSSRRRGLAGVSLGLDPTKS